MVKHDFARLVLKYVLMVGAQCFCYDLASTYGWGSEAFRVQDVIIYAWLAYIPAVMLLKGVRAEKWHEIKEVIIEELRDIPWNLCYVLAEFTCYYVMKWFANWIGVDFSKTGVLIFSITGCSIFDLIQKNAVTEQQEEEAKKKLQAEASKPK